MKSGIIKTIKGNWLIFVCLAAAAILAALVVVELLGGLAKASETRQGLAGAFHQNAKDPNGTKGAVDAAKKVADALKKKNLFTKEPPKEHPIKQVDGILGSEALIQNKWYKAGEKVGDAKILSISATGIQVEWNGKKTTISPIASAPPQPSGPSRPAEPNKARASEPNKPAKKADANEVKVVTVKADDPLAFMGTSLSEKVRGILLRMWDKVPDDQKEKAKEQWTKMSDAEKQQALQALENMPEEQIQQAIQSMGSR
jgi:hypothetical protein